jgi:LPS sulfotransferase NodH
MAPPLDWHPHFGRIGGKDLAAWLADYPPSAPPTRSIMLATDERTGSEFLCQILGASGRLGRPSEYLNTYWMRCFIPDYPEDVGAQVTIAHRVGTTNNGCFAMKLHAVQLERLLTGSRVETAFPNPVFVRLYRRDLLAQAISLYRARYGSQYHAHLPAARPVDFDAAAIQAMMVELTRSKARWALYFARNGVTPLAIAYEDLAADPEAVVRALGDHAGIAAAPHTVTEPLQVQHDTVTEEWRRRFLAERHDLNVLDDP